MKSKVLNRIEKKLQDLEEDSYRYKVLDTCRRFKTTWMDLGQALYTVHRDKLYRDWNFLTFEKYCASELGIKNATALKLMRSYHFLETDEPAYLKRVVEKGGTQKHADLESVNLLRLAHKTKETDEEGYDKIRDQVLEEAKEPQDVRRAVRMRSEQMKENNPQEARADRRLHFLKNLFRQLENAKLDAMANRFLSAKLIDQLDILSQRVEKELSRNL